MRDVSGEVREKIAVYGTAGGLLYTAEFMLSIAKVKHNLVKSHSERLALLAEAVASHLGKDHRAAFFGGVFHDLGKILLPPELFDGHDITAEEYELVKTHARIAFEVLKDLHFFIALCAGLHHAMRKSGYGLSLDDFPKEWSPATIKKVCEISLIISICDYIDASHRTTEIKDGSAASGATLLERLLKEYPDDRLVVETALAAADELKLYDA